MACPPYSVLSSVYIKEKPEYLRRCIESIVSQTVLTDDYVIVKDGPITEELDCVVKEYESKYQFIHVYGYEKNHGLGYALNYGLKLAKNNIVARMDTDDISLPNRCECQLKEFILNPSLDVVGTSIYEFDGEEKNIISIKNMPETNAEIKKYARRRNPFNHPTVMYKKTSVMACGGYKVGQRGEDFSLFTKMVFEGCVSKNINEKLFLYRADCNQFKRRSSWTDAKAVISVVSNNFANHYITLMDFLFVLITQFIGVLIPSYIGNIMFRKLFRGEHI